MICSVYVCCRPNILLFYKLKGTAFILNDFFFQCTTNSVPILALLKVSTIDKSLFNNLCIYNTCSSGANVQKSNLCHFSD